MQLPGFFIGVKLAGGVQPTGEKWALIWPRGQGRRSAGAHRYRGGCPTGGHNLSSKVCKACPTIDWPTYRRQRKVDTRSSRRGGGGGRGADKRTTVEEGEGEKKKGLRLLSRYYR